MKKLLFTMSCLTMAVVLGDGITATWTNRTQRLTASWGNVENWADVTEPPTNGESVVLSELDSLPAERAYVKDDAYFSAQKILTDKTEKLASSPYRVDPIVGTLTGGSGYTIQIDTYSSSSDAFYPNGRFNKSADGRWHRYFDVMDPNSFLGFWEPLGMFAAMKLHPSESFTPILNNFSTRHRPQVEVPTNRAEIGYQYNGGALDKVGAGELEIKSTDLNPAYYWLRGGMLTFNGHTNNAVEAILARAAFHLDASVASSFVTHIYEATNLPAAPRQGAVGEVAVMRWNDVRNNGKYAFCQVERSSSASAFTHFTQPPLLLENTPSAGLSLVDFGGRYFDGGRTNCTLEIGPSKIEGVRAAFYVGDSPKGAKGAIFLGDTSSLQFCAGDTDSVLYDRTYSDTAVRNAEITINGVPTAYDKCTEDELKKLYVYGAGISRDVRVGLLGSREYYVQPAGGVRMGEVILFTEELTREERARVVAYLRQKWQNVHESFQEASGVNALKEAAVISVKEGGTAKVGDVYAQKGIVKKGEGTLSIATLLPTTAVVKVEGGSVAFERGTLPTEVPSDAYIWLDAAKIGTDTETVGDITYVNNWADSRSGVSTFATYGDTAGGTHRPTYVANSPFVNRPVVDMGDYGGEGKDYLAGRDSAAWMKFPNWKGTASTYEYFAVMRFKYDPNGSNNGAKNAAILGSSDMSGYRDTAARVISPNYINVVTMGARWTINGETIDPQDFDSTAMSKDTNNFFVVAVASSTPFKADGIAKDRCSNDVKANCGGIEVGELITYERKLSLEEHLAVEKYLLEKWLGKAHPKITSAIPSMTFAEDVAPIVNANYDLTIEALAGNEGKLVKQGVGAVTIPKLAVTNVCVEAGELTIKALDGAFLNDAKFHFDASDESSFTTDAQGGILEWADVRKNGVKATADTDGLANVKPILVDVETRAGVTRKAVDFGELSWTTNGVGEVKNAASMSFSQTFSVEDAVTVLADAHGSKYQSFFCDTTTHQFNRGFTGTMFNSDKSKPTELCADGMVVNAKVLVDGVKKSWTSTVADGYHIINWMLLTAAEGTRGSGWWTRSIGAFSRWTYTCKEGNVAIDRRGGQYISEQLGFSYTLSDAQRTWLLQYLNCKWYGAAPTTNYVDSVEVAAGATANFVISPYEITKVSSLSGAGKVKGSAFALGGTMAATIQNGSTSHLVIDGALALAGPITLNLTADISAGKLEGGDYPILEATSITGFDALEWSINVITAGPNLGKVTLIKNDNVIYAHIPFKGLKLFIR